jgi:Fe2+ transport system protein B
MEITLPDVSQSFQKTKGFLTEKVEKAVNSTSQATAQAKSSLSETADKAKEALTQTTNSAVNSVNQATNSAVDTLNQTTSKAVDSVTQVTEKAKASLQDSLDKAENISGAASDAIKSAIYTTTTDWMDAHPVILWLVSHPLIGLAILLLFILIILGLFQALGSFFTEGWLLILQSPGKLIQKVFNVGSKSISNLGGVTVNSLASSNPGLNNNSALQVRGVESNSLDSQERLANILGRLEEIRHEQSQLLEEVSAILGK